MSDRNWCITKNFKSKDNEKICKAFYKDKKNINQLHNTLIAREFKHFIWSVERGGEEDCMHIQGYLEHTKKTTLLTIKDLLKGTILENCHIERAKGSAKQNHEYCSKKETHIHGPHTFGRPAKKRQGKRTDLEKVADMLKKGKSIMDINEEHTTTYIKYSKGIKESQSQFMRRKCYKWTPDQRHAELRIHVIWGDAGTGKTRSIYEKHDIEDIYVLCRKNNGNLWFDNYEGQSVLLIDEFNGWIPHGMLLQLLDIYPMSVDVKGGTTYNLWKTVYILSNVDPEEWYKNLTSKQCKALKRRFHTITELVNPDEEESESESSSGSDD